MSYFFLSIKASFVVTAENRVQINTVDGSGNNSGIVAEVDE
jgi:hypothetical protein